MNVETWERIERARERWNVLRHPFYQRWSAGELSGDELANALRKQGVIVAPGGPLGEDHHIRAAVRNQAATTRLLRAVENLVGT